MTLADDVYRYTFNVLAELIVYGNVINTHCRTREECEETMERLVSVIETMKKQIDRMEN